ACVSLSDAQAKLMQTGVRDINMERVEALKTSIRNGELKMDTGKIADSLIREAHSYLQTK
ncbi:flagellar biosynthesis anti-sigma factor FlgM, partial [Salmonella enterica subsp. enterica serovar Infantis]